MGSPGSQAKDRQANAARDARTGASKSGSTSGSKSSSSPKSNAPAYTGGGKMGANSTQSAFTGTGGVNPAGGARKGEQDLEAIAAGKHTEEVNKQTKEALRAYEARKADYEDEDNAWYEDLGNWFSSAFGDTYEKAPSFSFNNLSDKATWATDFGAMGTGFVASVFGGPLAGIVTDKLVHWGLDQIPGGNPFEHEWNNPGNNSMGTGATGWMGGGSSSSSSTNTTGSSSSQNNGTNTGGSNSQKSDTTSGTQLGQNLNNYEVNIGSVSNQSDNNQQTGGGQTETPPVVAPPADTGTDLLDRMLGEFNMYAMPQPKTLNKNIHDDLLQQLMDYRSAA